MPRPQQMAAHPEEILDDAVDGGEALQMDRRLEAPHLALTLSRRLVRDFRPVRGGGRAVAGVAGRWRRRVAWYGTSWEGD